MILFSIWIRIILNFYNICKDINGIVISVKQFFFYNISVALGDLRVRLRCNGDTVSPLHPAVGSTWMNESSGIQQLGATVIPYHRCTIAFSVI